MALNILMNGKRRELRRIYTVVDKELVSQLETIAKNKGVPVSVVVRDILNNWFSGEKSSIASGQANEIEEKGGGI